MAPLDRLVTARIGRLSVRRRAALYRAVEAAEEAASLFHRHRVNGRAVPHPIALTPFVVPRRALAGLARLADAVHRIQAWAPVLYHQAHADFRALCPVSETTSQWLARDPRRAPASWSLMIRPDVGVDVGRDGRLAPVLFETNATALAGLYNHTAGVRILRAEVFPRTLAPEEARRLGDPPDLLHLTVRWVSRAARRLGQRRLRGVAFVEDEAPVDGYSEVPRLVAAFRSVGVPAVHGTPADLVAGRTGLSLRGVPVDVVYRDLAYEDVGPASTAARRLPGFVGALTAGAIVPGPGGEFAHKGLLECLGRPEYYRLFSLAERRLLRAVVPWTRVLGPRHTDAPDGGRVDLPEYARRGRAGLVIKPNVGSSGTGVLLGHETPPQRWEARIEKALREPGRWVVQARRPGARRRMVDLRAGKAYVGPCYASLGLFYAPGDLGLHCRVSREPIVNVARQGAVACAFLEGSGR